jgi:hypothetical protein
LGAIRTNHSYRRNTDLIVYSCLNAIAFDCQVLSLCWKNVESLPRTVQRGDQSLR